MCGAAAREKEHGVSEHDSAIALVNALEAWGATHVVWLPCTETQHLHQGLARSRLCSVPVCREGEAIPVAIGLYAGGKKPVVVIQNTGFFESGDSIRGLAIPMHMPLPLVIGYRGYRRDAPMTDTAAIYLEPILKTWGITYYLIDPPDEGRIQAALQESWDKSCPVAVLLPEAGAVSR